MSSSSIVTEAFPGAKDGLLVGTRQLGNGGEQLKKALESGNHRGDRRLLKHHLADPNPVWVAIVSPRKIAAVAIEPNEQPPT
jgi:hypothetical protein